MRLKVLQVNKLYYPHIGGVEKVVQEIAEGLSDRIDMRVLVCQPSRKGKSQDIINGIPVTRVGSLGTFWSMPLSPTFPIHLHALGKWADILHFHMPFPLGDLSYLFSPKKKVVVTWHSDIIRQKRALKFYTPLLNKFLSSVDRIIITSPAPLKYSPFLAPFRDKCQVIPLGIRDYWLQEPSFIKPKNRTILFVGRLCYYKGVEYLIDAMVHIDADLVIIGDGELRSELQEKTIQLGIDHKVFFLVKCSDDELRAWYHSSDLFVLPSVEPSEAFALVQVEAMAAGTPVVNTHLPSGVPFVSLHGKTGLTVEPRNSNQLAEAINCILSDENLAREFSKNAKERVLELFTVEHMLDSIYSLYTQL